MRGNLTAGLLVVLAFFATTDHAAACTVRCPTQSVAEDAVHTDAIFVGRVVRVTQRETTFEVSRFWKGQVGRTISLDTLNTDCFSSYRFLMGETYLVLARKDFFNPADKNAAPFISGTCDRQSFLAQAKDDMEALDKALGPGKIPKWKL